MDDGLHNLVGRRAVIRHGGLLQDESLGGGLAREADGVDGGGIDRDHRRLVIEVDGPDDCVRSRVGRWVKSVLRSMVVMKESRCPGAVVKYNVNSTCVHVLAQVDRLDGGGASSALLVEAADGDGDIPAVRGANVRNRGCLQDGILRHGLAREADVGNLCGVDGDGRRSVVEGEHHRVRALVIAGVRSG